MLRLNEVRLPLDHPEDALRAAVLARTGVPADKLKRIEVFRRNWDARSKAQIVLTYTLDVEVEGEEPLLQSLKGKPNIGPRPVVDYAFPFETPLPPLPSSRGEKTKRPLVIGAGPCGLFAALVLAQMGFRPIILERGKVVRERTKDTWGLWRRSVLNPTSNVQFGEGGAGTFSDGKLYSGIKDRHCRDRKVLTEFVKAGAPDEILYVGKPHIGTFRLVTMVESMRATIEALGGEYRFQSKVIDFAIDTGADGTRRIAGVKLETGEEIEATHVVLALGHSARDTFQVLHDRGVYLEAKPFSIGVRIEHPQSLIDKARFGRFAGNKILGAADYKLVHHAKNGRSAYSFCMCPGGTVVAAASEPDGVVTNGMSQYSRAERNANAGIVVGITPEVDYPGHPLAGVEFQRRWERLAFKAGGENFKAPGQRVGDLLAGRASKDLGSVVPSYKPGVTPTDLATCLPDFVIDTFREALPQFGRQIDGFDMPDALMTGVETRTSSPVRIKRDATFQSLNTRGLFPGGEGAGYAGGILSAGVDGIRLAEAVAADIAASLGVQVPALRD
ncbi:MAG: hypothetical protein EKK41_21990 [Hyphomicrobiales bacterium]|nr:MAG: hypothetical protein EKK41_21990 [Hyphomicrobiales bacterium]